MESKAVVFACLLLFFSMVVIVSAVSEGNQEQPEKVEAAKETPVEESKQHCHYGCCRYYGHSCVKCCDHPAEAQANNMNNNVQQDHQVETSANRWGGWGGGRGRGGGWGGDRGHGGGWGGDRGRGGGWGGSGGHT